MRTDTERVRVRQLVPCPDNRSVSSLGRVDYEDAFLVEVGPTGTRTAEQWARAILQDAPARVRLRLLAAWTAIGFKLNLFGGDRSVIGWQIRSDDSDFVVLGADSRVGMSGELLVRRAENELLFCTFIRFDNAFARALWAAIEDAHVRTVCSLLELARRRVAD